MPPRRFSVPDSHLRHRREMTLTLDGLVVVRHTSHDASFDNHVHVSVPMLMVVQRGKKSVRSNREGKRAVAVAAGQAVFVAPGDYVMSEEVAHCQALLLCFEPEFIARFPHQPSPVLRQPSRVDSPVLVRLTRFLAASLESLTPLFGAAASSFPELLEHKLHEVVLTLLNAEPRAWKILQEAARPGERGLIRYLESRLAERATLSQLARGAGRSLSAFKQQVRNATGTSPAAWLRARRLERAHRLLQTTDRAVLEIAMDVGYASPSHFVRAFRRQFRVTPLAVRKSQKRQRSSRARKK